MEEFIQQVLAFQKKARELAVIRMSEGCVITGFVFEADNIRVCFDYPDYEGSGSILIPWSDVLYC